MQAKIPVEEAPKPFHQVLEETQRRVLVQHEELAAASVKKAKRDAKRDVIAAWLVLAGLYVPLAIALWRWALS